MKHYSPWKESFSIVSHAQLESYLTFISWVLMVESQVANLIFGLFFDHNLNLRSPNGECNPIFDIYIWKPFPTFKRNLALNTIYYLHFYFKHSNIARFQFQKCWHSFSHTCKSVFAFGSYNTFLACSPFMPWLWAQI